MTLEERLITAEACRWADEVASNVPYDPSIKLLDDLNCSHVAHGDDIIYKADGSNCYSEFMDSNRFLMFKRTEGISSTDIVGRLLLMTAQNDNKLTKNLSRKLSNDGEDCVKASTVNED